jgi:hypothetical protein
MSKKELQKLQNYPLTEWPYSQWVSQLEDATPIDFDPQPQETLTMFWNANNFLVKNPVLLNRTRETTRRFVFESGLQSYQQAIMFQITGNVAYARNVMRIIRQWVNTTTLYEPERHNRPLVLGWTLASWLKAAELLKYTFSEWDTELEQDLLNWIVKLKVEEAWDQVLTPNTFSTNLPVGNWHTTIAEAKLYLAFLRDDKEGVDFVVNYYKRMVDGIENPNNPQQRDLIYIGETGQQFEMCRDIDHTNYGTGGLVQIAEAMFHQGIDLYSYGPTSALEPGLPGLAQVLETTSYIGNFRTWPPGVAPNGTIWKPSPNPEFVQGEGCKLTQIGFKAGGYEIGFHHFHRRLGYQMKQTRDLLATRYKDFGPDMYYFHWGLGSFTHGQYISPKGTTSE